jgi:ankyrin repeat protein
VLYTKYFGLFEMLYDLIEASKNNNLTVFSMLLRVHNITLEGNIRVLFHTAIIHGSVDVVDYILLKSKSIQEASINFAMRYSAENGHFRMVDILLNYGADPSTDNNYPIIAAATNKCTKVMEILLTDNRVDPSAMDNEALARCLHWKYSDIAYMLVNDPRFDPTRNTHLIKSLSRYNTTVLDIINFKLDKLT